MTLNDERLFGSIAVAKEIGISLRQLYYWVHVLGVVQPQLRQCGRRKFRRFTRSDVKKLDQVRRLVGRGYTLKAAVAMLRRRSSERG